MFLIFACRVGFSYRKKQQDAGVSVFKDVRINHSKLFAKDRNHINGIENFWNSIVRQASEAPPRGSQNAICAAIMASQKNTFICS